DRGGGLLVRAERGAGSVRLPRRLPSGSRPGHRPVQPRGGRGLRRRRAGRRGRAARRTGPPAAFPRLSPVARSPGTVGCRGWPVAGDGRSPRTVGGLYHDPRVLTVRPTGSGVVRRLILAAGAAALLAGCGNPAETAKSSQSPTPSAVRIQRVKVGQAVT